VEYLLRAVLVETLRAASQGLEIFNVNLRNKGETPFQLGRVGDLNCLRDTLVTAGFNKAALDEIAKHGLIDLPVLVRLTANNSPLHNLIRLFKLGRQVAIEAARSALEPMNLADLIDLGLLRHTNGNVIAEAGLTPEIGGLYVAHDFDPAFTGELPDANHVLEVGPSSQTLAALTVRRECERALDLCAGAGIQSMLAAKHCAKVVATDINRRALNFAELNARLNGISNLELRQGNLYEPVMGESFDLIVANPPYIISPRARYVYRDSGMQGDTVCERVIREAPSHLNDGGYCVVLFNWHHCGEEDWSQRPLEWIADNGCDVWLLRFGTQSPAPYAFRWLRHCEGRNGADLEELLDEWLAYYGRLGIGLFSFGLLVMRRRATSTNWVRTDTMQPEWTAANCSDQIARIFAAQDLLEELTNDDSFLDQRFALAPDHEMRHELRVENRSWIVTSATLRQTGGFEFIGRLDVNVVSLLAGCDGSRTLRELLADMARRLHIDFSLLAPVGIEVMRSLMRSGFLVLPYHPCFAERSLG
jgi:methylase of polypeptide subunit release factors